MELIKKKNSPEVVKQKQAYSSPSHDQDSVPISPKGYLNKEILTQIAVSGNVKEEINDINSPDKQSNLPNFFSSQGNFGLYMSQSELLDIRQAHHHSQSQSQQVNQMSQMSSGHHQQQISQMHHQNYQQISQSQSFRLHTQQMGFPENDPENSVDGDEDDEEDNKNNNSENLSHQNCNLLLKCY